MGKPFELNNVVINGKYEHNIQNFPKGEVRAQLEGNTLRIWSHSYTLTITKNHYSLLVRQILSRAIWIKIQQFVCDIANGERVWSLTCPIVNIHVSGDIEASRSQLIEQVIPALHAFCPIRGVKLQQETIPEPISAEQLLNPSQFESSCLHVSSSIFLEVKSGEEKKTIRFQKDKKDSSKTHVTIISTTTDKLFSDVLNFFEKEKWQDSKRISSM